MPKINESAKEWQKRLALRVGSSVQARRKELNLTASALAERTASLGYPISRVAIGKIETGHREGKCDLAELVVLAAALGLPPVMLIYPNLPHGRIEVLPEIDCDAADAVGWFCGDSPRLDKRLGVVDLDAYLIGVEPLLLTRELMAAESELARVRHLMTQLATDEAARKADDATGGHTAELVQSTLDANESLRVQTIRRMQALGLALRTGDDDTESKQ